MAKKIRRAKPADRRELVRLFLVMSLVNTPGVLAVLAASWGVIPWLYAILIFVVSMAVGWSFMLKTMSRMGLLWYLRRNTS
jgi:nitrate reductase NapE component